MENNLQIKNNFKSLETLKQQYNLKNSISLAGGFRRQLPPIKLFNNNNNNININNTNDKTNNSGMLFTNNNQNQHINNMKNKFLINNNNANNKFKLINSNNIKPINL